MRKGVFRQSEWITEDHLIYNVDKIPQDWAHEGLTRTCWVTLILPPFLSCSHNIIKKKRKCREEENANSPPVSVHSEWLTL